MGELPQVSLPTTERLQDLLDPILGRQLVQLMRLVLLVLWNQEQKLYRNCRVTVGLCRCAPVPLSCCSHVQQYKATQSADSTSPRTW